MNDKISIIIPVFNTEKYLHRCLDSIVRQTYRNIEIIIIDDGSTDSSGKICEEYKNNDCRIIVLHQENKGIGAAYEAGLNIVTGKYVTFIDSDDYISPDMIEALYNNIILYNADISQCSCSYQNEFENIDNLIDNSIVEIRIFEPNNKIVKMYLDEITNEMYFKRNVGMKMYKTALFSDYHSEEGIQFVDIIMLFLALLKCNKYVWTSAVYYYIYMRQNSVSRGANSLQHIRDNSYYERILNKSIKDKYPQFSSYIPYYNAKFSMLHYREVYSDKIEEKDELLQLYRKRFNIYFEKCIHSDFFKNSNIMFRVEMILFRVNPKLCIYMRKLMGRC